MTPDVERMLAAGEGKRPYGKLMARLCVVIDEFVADSAGGDPGRAATAFAQLGMTRTAALFGVVDGPPVAMPWDQLDVMGSGASVATQKPSRSEDVRASD